MRCGPQATRRQDSRAGLRYDTDLTDAEWRLVEALREIVNAIFYVLCGGIPWHLLPNSMAFLWFAAWRDQGMFEVMNHALGGQHGYDAGEEVMGRKQHALIDTGGRALERFTHPASVQDRDGGPPLINASCGSNEFRDRLLENDPVAR